MRSLSFLVSRFIPRMSVLKSLRFVDERGGGDREFEHFFSGDLKTS